MTSEPSFGLRLALTKLETPGRVRKFPQITFEFHIARSAREYYEFDESLFSLTGNVILPNFLATRLLAKKMNDKRDIVNNPEKAILPGQLNAMGLIDEILHYVAGLYREEKGQGLFGQALEFISRKIGAAETDKVLSRFSDVFPNVEVWKGQQSSQEFLAGTTDGVSHREMIMEEILMLWLANMNPAFGPYIELFDDRELKAATKYGDFITALHDFFDTVPGFGPENQNLVDMLRAPAIAVPYSLYGQLQYMREKWGMLLGKYLLRLLSSLDFMKEEERLFWKGGFKTEGYGSALSFGGMEGEPERFSTDKEWMPRVLLLAKSTLVWLDQLTKKYGREIRRLDQIPDEEIDIIAHRGFTGLWLIGLWERSKASKRIKQMCGNPEAEASAYSLYDYDIAWELGGWDALNVLREKCWRRGVRVASDMVPNHTAMDSKWISEHPDWFLQLDHSPFPGYTFNGPDLSQDGNIEVKLEDHYFDRSDAAVVFLHRDKHTNRHRFIYHGNDGTSMPWNDTAQLDYLNPAAREAVIQVILHVARNFPIIRFDAAMTLAKKHVQRLWYPLPGSGGDIATRAEHAMSKEDFDRAIPEEFWREVVDRVAKEVPDTLLLAEAFWMMEGYFVRTLGMHRVYNSAFMHMFKKEENEKYRYTIKNTLEFDPDILKRFVNFMNNPDEETAAVQFGTGDKYFGVATMMITMPGTPMFGHGQVEGFREKYGMEYRRAYWDEKEDQGLIDRHEKEIFPLMHRRHVFAEVQNFYLYDLWTPQGFVNQNVFAYSNGWGEEKALVMYNNAYDKAMGWIKTSSGYAIKKGDGSKVITQKDLGAALGLHGDHNKYVLMREQNANLWYIRKSQEILSSGLYIELGGYQKQVFLDIHEVEDNDQGHFGRLCYELGGRGVEDIDEALKEIFFRPLYNAFNDLVNVDNFKGLYALARGEFEPDAQYWSALEGKVAGFFWRAKEFTGGKADPAPLIQDTLESFRAVFKMTQVAAVLGDNKTVTKAVGYLDTRLRAPSFLPYALIAKAILSNLGKIMDSENAAFLSRSLMDDWFLDRKIRRVFTWIGMHPGEAHHLVHMVKVMITNQDWTKVKASAKELPGVCLEKLLQDQEIQNMIGENRYDGVLYFNKEGFEYSLWWIFAAAALEVFKGKTEPVALAEELKVLYDILEKWLQALSVSDYKVEALLDFLLPGRAKKGSKPKAPDTDLPSSGEAPAKPKAKAPAKPKKSE